MINKQEIMSFSKKYKLSPNVLEKDYILNWILYGIANSDILKDKWIFKGGTCLKKCYFEEYRFSEDLDFTIVDKNHLNTTFLLSEFLKISDWIYEQSGIEIIQDGLRFEEYKNPRDKISVQGTIAYRGPMQRIGSNSTVKLDLSNDEILVEKPQEKNIYHPYSDRLNIKILCYSIEEIFSEKLRTLVERLRPRDLYDVIHLYTDKRWKLNKNLVKEILNEKCNFKNVTIPTMGVLNEGGRKKDLISDWENMLRHQIADLESYDYYWSQLPAIFEWLK